MCVGEVVCCSCWFVDLDRAVSIGCTTVAYVTLPVVFPTVEVAIGSYGQGVPVAGTDLHVGEVVCNAGGFAHGYWCASIGGGAVTQLVGAVAHLLNSEIFKGTRADVHVITDEGASRGLTYADFRLTAGDPKPTLILQHVERAKFAKLLMDSLSILDKRYKGV